jgi:hypothetical protein
MDWEAPLQRVAFLGCFLPRRSRTSAATTFLFNTLAGAYADIQWTGVAVSDLPHHYAYPAPVRLEIIQENSASYLAAAEYLNLAEIEVACIQYEGGTFGGPGGSHLLAFLRALEAPAVIVFSHIPERPTLADQQVMSDLASFSRGVVVFSPAEADYLAEELGIDPGTIEIFDMPEQDPAGSNGEATILAERYMTFFQQVLKRDRLLRMETAAGKSAFSAVRSAIAGGIPVTGGGTALPVLRLDHFLRMTDDTGLLRASIHGLPDIRQGYATADNALALMFALLLERDGEIPLIPVERLAGRHMAFLLAAFNEETGRFRGTMSYARAWQDEEGGAGMRGAGKGGAGMRGAGRGSEETHGMVVWALGMLLGRSAKPDMTIQIAARDLFEAARPAAAHFTSPLAWAYLLLGLDEYLRRFPGDRAVDRFGRLLLGRLVQLYERQTATDWRWPEDSIPESSAILPRAMIAFAGRMGNARAVEIGMEMLEWLASLQYAADGHFTPLGHPGYCRRGGEPARFAQHTAEAYAMVTACLEAYRLNGDSIWLDRAGSAFSWFLGSNDLGLPLYDPRTGICRDGLAANGLLQGCGARSLLDFLLSQLEMRLFRQQQADNSASRLLILPIGSPNPLISPDEQS